MADVCGSAAYQAAYEAVIDEIASVPTDQRDEPGVCGFWTLRDLMGHLAYWDQMQAEELRAIAAGQSYEGEEGDEDVINAREVSNRSTHSWDQVMAEVAKTYADLQPLVDDPGESNAEFRIHEHWEEHLAQIRDWKAGLND